MLQPTVLKDGRSVAHGFAFFSDSFNGHRVVQHFGSTVGGFGSIVRYFPKEDVTVAVIGNLEDADWEPNISPSGFRVTLSRARSSPE